MVPNGAGTTIRVLLVEDDDGDAALVREMLRFAFHGVAVDVSKVRCLSELPPLIDPEADVVLLDLSLPDATGLAGVAEVTTRGPDTPVIVLTGLDDQELALAALHMGAQDYLVKGTFDEALLGRSIRYAVERKRAEVALAYQARHDALTGLANRSSLFERLECAEARARRNGKQIALLLLDIDNFKVVNDSLGHETGDVLLVHVADRITTILRPGDVAARLGGDEFLVLCENVEGEDEALVLAERLATALGAPVGMGGRDLVASVSIGVAMSGTRVEVDPRKLLREADAAMYRAKEAGRSQVAFFGPEMHARALRRLEVESRLRAAVGSDELRLEFQPELDLTTGRTVALEALVRWEHPTEGRLMPSDFIPAAEQTGLIVPLGEWVLREACRQFVDLDGSAALTLAVNVSVRQLKDDRLRTVVMEALAETGLSADRLCLEVTETSLLIDPEGSARRLGELRNLGVSIYIDDFGSDYSSLQYLLRLPIDGLKLDGSFAAGLVRFPRGRAVVQGIASLAHSLGLVTVVEGLESLAQFEEVRSAGCDMGQGYLWAVPQAKNEVAQWLAAAC